MLITPERKVTQRSDASQNDHKSKDYPSKTSEAAFTMQKADKGDLRRLARPPLKLSTHKVLQDDRFDRERHVLLADVLLRGC